MYSLTAIGKRRVQSFVEYCQRLRTELIHKGEDTGDNTRVPTEEEIVAHLNRVGLRADGFYGSAWDVTDNLDLDILLEYGEDKEITEDAPCIT